jgi:hypothetical protein
MLQCKNGKKSTLQIFLNLVEDIGYMQKLNVSGKFLCDAKPHFRSAHSYQAQNFCGNQAICRRLEPQPPNQPSPNHWPRTKSGRYQPPFHFEIREMDPQICPKCGRWDMSNIRQIYAGNCTLICRRLEQYMPEIGSEIKRKSEL